VIFQPDGATAHHSEVHMRKFSLLLPVVLLLALLALPASASADHPSKSTPVQTKYLRDKAEKIRGQIDPEVWGYVEQRGKHSTRHACEYGPNCRDHKLLSKARRTGRTVTFTWGGFFDVMECGMAIGAWGVVNAAVWPSIASRIKRAGGIFKLAKKLVTASTRAAKLKAATYFFVNVGGVEKIVDECGDVG
jgi:hypothetical protein